MTSISLVQSRVIRIIFLLGCSLFFTAMVSAEETSTTVTLYSSAQPGAISPELYRSGGPGQSVPGFGVVKQEREINLKQGRNIVRFTDVAAQIDPTTVFFESLSDPDGTRVLEQNFQFDLVNTPKLMEKYIDSEIVVEQLRGNAIESISGTLLSTSGGLVLRTKDGGVQVLNQYANVRFPNLPGGLNTRPTLVWDISAQKSGAQRTRVSYQTAGMTWWADYNVLFSDSGSCKLDVSAWVSILNQSGAGYADAKLKLVAGDVHRAAPARRNVSAPYMAKSMIAQDNAEGFDEKSFFEYHLYTLGRTTSLPQNSTKQVELFPAAHQVPCDKTLVYYGAPGNFGYGSPAMDRNLGTQSNKKVDVYLSFKNTRENHMGMPLPAGRVRVSKLDPTDKSLEFVGEDTVDHTAKDEKVLIKMGSAFDVVGERRQVDYRIDTARKTIDEDIEIKLRNHKNEAVTVLVKENLYRWNNWEITRKTQDFEKIDARTIHFPVKISKDGEAIVRYTVHYSW